MLWQRPSHTSSAGEHLVGNVASHAELVSPSQQALRRVDWDFAIDRAVVNSNATITRHCWLVLARDATLFASLLTEPGCRSLVTFAFGKLHHHPTVFCIVESSYEQMKWKSLAHLVSQILHDMVPRLAILGRSPADATADVGTGVPTACSGTEDHLLFCNMDTISALLGGLAWAFVQSSASIIL
jgi:hypothetical protein